AHAQRGQAAEELSVRATVHICRFLLEEPHAGASRGTRIAPRRQGNGPEWGEVSARCGGSFWMAPLSGLAGRAPRRSTDGEGSSLSPVTRPANPDPATRTGSEPNGTTTTSPVPASGPWAGSEMAGLVLRPPMTVELRGAPGRSACAAISDNGATKPIPPEHTRTSPQSGPFPWRLGATPVRSLTAHDPTDPHPQDTNFEVDQQPERFLQGTQVGGDLGDVDREEHGDRFELDDQLIGNDQVQARLPHDARFVCDRDRYLPPELQPSRGKLGAKGLLVDSLEEPRTENAMDLDGCPNGSAGQVVDLGARLYQVSSLIHLQSSDRWLDEFPTFVPGKGGRGNGDGADYGAPSHRPASRPPFADTNVATEWRSQCVKL